jgi:hypothetical protein
MNNNQDDGFYTTHIALESKFITEHSKVVFKLYYCSNIRNATLFLPHTSHFTPPITVPAPESPFPPALQHLSSRTAIQEASHCRISSRQRPCAV